MPDLTEHTTYTCSTNEEWELQVPGSKGASYTVRFSRLYGRDAEIQRCQHGYTCSCPAFTKGLSAHMPCKHIKAAREYRCAWNWEFEPTAEPDRDENGNPCCPQCGRPVSAHRVRV